MMSWNTGDMIILHVPIEKPLSHENQQALGSILEKWGFHIPSSWADQDTSDVYGYYYDNFQGYVLDHSMTKKPLKDAFHPDEPVEQFMNVQERYDAITQDMCSACGRLDILVARSKVGFVSFE